MTGKKPEKSGHCSCSTDEQYVNPSFEQDVCSTAAASSVGGLAATYNSRRPSGNFTHTIDYGTGGVNSSKDCTTNDSGCCAMHNNSNSTSHRKGHRYVLF